MTVFEAGRWLCGAAMALLVCPAASHAQEAAAPAHEPSSGRAFVARHCAGCHNDRLKTGGLSLQGLDPDDVSARADVWEKVLRKVRSGEMPPAIVRARPDPAAADSFVSSLEGALDAEAAAHPNPGTPGIHRLNRAEYSNAIRDLLHVDIDPGAWLPVDDSGYGFDNIAAVLSTSPALLERYMLAARRVSRLAVGDPAQKPYEELYDAVRDPFKGIRNEQLSDDLPFDSRAGIAIRHYFPVDADYVFKVRFRGLPAADPALEHLYEIRLTVPAGLHRVGVTSPRENAKLESETGPAGAVHGNQVPDLPYPVDLRLDGMRRTRFDVPGGMPEVARLIIAGPYAPTGRGETPARAAIFTCRPRRQAEEVGCARRILGALARHAFRRPVDAADVDPLLALYRRGRAQGDFDAGIQSALEGLLVAPEFLFRLERNPPGARPGTAYRVSGIELASRLSFFLWSSIPDEALLGAAERGDLGRQRGLERQVRRMLADPRSDALIRNFAGQWLQLRNVRTVQPDPVIFGFDESLRRAMVTETELLFTAIVREDRSLLELLSADYTFLNERLAAHYGVPDVYGSQFRRVPAVDPNRRGLLGQGSILTLTSYPNRTSVVQRGKWILENLLGTPPPPPPPDVPELKTHKDGRALSLRDQMQAHRANAVCAACHARMDPIGFALENYDGIGAWRTEDAGTPIDPSGRLPDGTAFEGPAGLTGLLLTRYRDDFVRTAIEKLLTYALGRGVEYYDEPVVRTIARDAASRGYTVSSLIAGVIASTPFQMRRASEP